MIAACPECGVRYRYGPLPARVRASVRCQRCGYAFMVYSEPDGEATATVTMSPQSLVRVTTDEPLEARVQQGPERVGDDLMGPLAALTQEPPPLRADTPDTPNVGRSIVPNTPAISGSFSQLPAGASGSLATSRSAFNPDASGSVTASQTIIAMPAPAAQSLLWLWVVAAAVVLVLGVVAAQLVFPSAAPEARAGRFAIEVDAGGAPAPARVPPAAPAVAPPDAVAPQPVDAEAVAPAPVAAPVARPRPALGTASSVGLHPRAPAPAPAPVAEPPVAEPLVAEPPASTAAATPADNPMHRSDLRDPFGDLR